MGKGANGAAFIRFIPNSLSCSLCVTCASGEYEDDGGPTFVCCWPGGPRWKGGEETERVCDSWERLGGE
jgi:hypothetical protein